jgi:hypothetical protein
MMFPRKAGMSDLEKTINDALIHNKLEPHILPDVVPGREGRWGTHHNSKGNGEHVGCIHKTHQ